MLKSRLGPKHNGAHPFPSIASQETALSHSIRMTPDCTMHEKTARLPQAMLTQTAERRPHVIRTKSTGREDSTKPPGYESKTPLPSLTGPAKIFEEDRVRLREWLDSKDQPFTVRTVPLSHKRKWNSARQQVQGDLFEERLTVCFEMQPWKEWKSLRRYKKFTGKKG
jgi:hypothetical protein